MNLNLQTQPGAVSFKQNQGETLRILSNLSEGTCLSARFKNAQNTMGSAVRTYLEDLVAQKLEKNGDNPVDWTKLTKAVKETVKNDQKEGKTFTYYYKNAVHTYCDTVDFNEALKNAEIVVTESHIYKLTEELKKTAEEYNEIVIQHYFHR